MHWLAGRRTAVSSELLESFGKLPLEYQSQRPLEWDDASSVVNVRLNGRTLTRLTTDKNERNHFTGRRALHSCMVHSSSRRGILLSLSGLRAFYDSGRAACQFHGLLPYGDVYSPLAANASIDIQKSLPSRRKYVHVVSASVTEVIPAIVATSGRLHPMMMGAKFCGREANYSSNSRTRVNSRMVLLEFKDSSKVSLF